MRLFIPFIVVLFFFGTELVQGERATVNVKSDWDDGFYSMFTVKIRRKVDGGWKITLRFSQPIKSLDVWVADVKSKSANRKVWILTNKPWNGDLANGASLVIGFNAKKDDKHVDSPAPKGSVFFKRLNGQVLTQAPTFMPTTPQHQTTMTKLTETREPTTKPQTTMAKTPQTTIPTTEQPITTPDESTNAPSTGILQWPPVAPFPMAVVNNWNSGFKGKFVIHILQNVINGWKLTITFSKSVAAVYVWVAEQVSQSADKKVFIMKNKYYNKVLYKGNTLLIEFNSDKNVLNEDPPTALALFELLNGGIVTSPPTQASTTAGTTSQSTTSYPINTQAPAGTTLPATTSAPVTGTNTPVTGPYDYKEVLHKSILFYEVQRSGKLPSSNRLKWRKDSALNDKGQRGEDLTGGWYDAGDYVKFGFPMAGSVTLLAWGLIEYKEAYTASGELQNALDSIKWPLDYFIKAHTAKYEFYGQVGDGDADHAYWGRPEDMTMARPAFKITTSKPGSDLAGETAAALAAGAIVFKETDLSYSNTLVRHAEELFEFADNYRGKYSDSISNAASFYASHSFEDELIWGAAWLYLATKKAVYLDKAKRYYQNTKPWAFSWDDKTAGAQVLMAKILPQQSTYEQDAKRFLDNWLPGGGIQYTPKGLAWRNKWGSNRYSANAAFLALVAADLGIKPTEYRRFARKQIHYMLGDAGRSFVVGFGKNPPQRPHHASSSCSLSPERCDWSTYRDPKPNPHVLYGALVGGPDAYDNYQDKRDDYVMNEVTTDYNAGFQSAVAGLKFLQIK